MRVRFRRVSFDSRTVRCARLCCITALAFVALSGPAHATFPGANGKIAFSACVPQDCGVWLMNPDGSGRTQITHNPYMFRGAPFEDTPASWSADGTKLAFTRYTVGSQEVWIVNSDGSNAHRVSGGLDPAWSPDGSRLVLYGGSMVNPDGSGLTQVIPGPSVEISTPDWSPDGTKIAYTGRRQDGFQDREIYVANADGTGVTSLTPPDFGGPRWQSSFPSWSPDGTQLVFSAGPPTIESGIYVMQADGSNKTLIAAPVGDGQFNASPEWSPDGTRILYQRYRTNQLGNELVVMDANGANPLVLGPGTSPAWQPIPNHPPDCSNVTATPGTLWPPNGKLVTVTLSGATDPDGDQVTLTITGATQDERTGRERDARLGRTADRVRLRAERRARGDGRVYRIALTVSDDRGGQCSGTATVGVPRRKSRPAVDSAPPSYDSLARPARSWPDGGQD